MAASGRAGGQRQVTSTASTADAVDVILRDGSTLRLHSPGQADRQALVHFFEALSERSLYLRFHGRPTVDERLVDPVLDPDWVDRGALAGSVIEAGKDRIVALANYVRLRDPLSAEVAFAVADDYQGRGIGTRLLEQLAARAAGEGIERFVAEVMADNAAMISVFESAGFEVTRLLSGGEVELTLPYCRDGRLHLARRGTRPHGRGRVAAPVLRGAIGRRPRRLFPPWHDRRGALSQHPGRRVHGRGVPRQPQRRARRGGTWLPLRRRHSRSGRSRRRLCPGGGGARDGGSGPRRRSPGCLRHLGRVRGGRLRRRGAPESRCSASFEPMAPASSGPTASASPRPR